MKLHLLLLSLLLVAPAGLRLQAQDPKPAAHHDDDDDTELGKKMHDLNGAFRKLKKQVADPAQNESSLALVATMRTNASAAAALEPAKKADVPAAEQAAFVAAYQKKMQETLTQLDALAAALKAGKNDEAAKLVDTLNNTEKEGHKEFRRPPAKK